MMNSDTIQCDLETIYYEAVCGRKGMGWGPPNFRGCCNKVFMSLPSNVWTSFYSVWVGIVTIYFNWGPFIMWQKRDGVGHKNKHNWWSLKTSFHGSHNIPHSSIDHWNYFQTSKGHVTWII